MNLKSPIEERVELVFNHIRNVIESWFNILTGKQSNWEFFVNINGGWLEMEYQHRYGPYASEKDQWEWMFLNAERIKLSEEDYDTLLKKLELD